MAVNGIPFSLDHYSFEPTTIPLGTWYRFTALIKASQFVIRKILKFLSQLIVCISFLNTAQNKKKIISLFLFFKNPFFIFLFKPF